MTSAASPEVLAVTSDLTFRSRIEVSLKNAGIPVRFVPGSRLAEALQESLPSLILIDYSECGEEGFQALSRLKQNTLTRTIPVLAYGPHMDRAGRERAQAAGADAVLANSQVASELPALVRKWAP